MSEVLTIEAKNIFISGDNVVHADYYPTNVGIEEAVMHGAELPYAPPATTPATVVSDYLSTARGEILKYLQIKFPNQYI